VARHDLQKIEGDDVVGRAEPLDRVVASPVADEDGFGSVPADDRVIARSGCRSVRVIA